MRTLVTRGDRALGPVRHALDALRCTRATPPGPGLAPALPVLCPRSSGGARLPAQPALPALCPPLGRRSSSLRRAPPAPVRLLPAGAAQLEEDVGTEGVPLPKEEVSLMEEVMMLLEISL